MRNQSLQQLQDIIEPLVAQSTTMYWYLWILIVFVICVGAGFIYVYQTKTIRRLKKIRSLYYLKLLSGKQAAQEIAALSALLTHKSSHYSLGAKCFVVQLATVNKLTQQLRFQAREPSIGEIEALFVRVKPLI